MDIIFLHLHVIEDGLTTVFVLFFSNELESWRCCK